MAREQRAATDHTLETIWEAQPGPQTALISCPVFEVFFGGARGGGKTDGVLGDFLEHADAYGDGAIGLMVRRERTQLVETIERSRQIYSPLGWKFHEQDKMWRAPNGARLRFAYLERDADAESYQGHSLTRVYVEEIGTFPSEAPILKLMATLRSGSGVPCGFRATGNPGGPGHAWVKARYINQAPMGWKVTQHEYVNPFTKQTITRDRVYIPSRVSDNRYLGAEYVANLQMSGNETLVRAWLEGDWSVIQGAFFPEWSNKKHVIAPFAIPATWTRFRSGDWGSASPFSFGWWAIVGDDYQIGADLSGGGAGIRPANAGADVYDGMAGRNRPDSERVVVLRRGSLVRYREWYGASAPNVGLKLPAENVADQIKVLEAADGKISNGVLDPSAFASDGGPSIAERMASRGVVFGRADNARVSQRGAMGGWDQLRARLRGDGERPRIFFFSTCVDSIRTIPALQHDTSKPEDVDCWVAGTVVATSSGLRAIETIRPGDFVETPIGMRPVLRSYVSGPSETILVKFSDGATLEGTPRHKIGVSGRGLIALENLQCYDIPIERITVCQRSLLFTAALFTRAMRGVFTTIRTGRFSLRAARAFTARCGLMLAGIFPRVSTSTTLMTTTTTTSFPISSAFLRVNTFDGTWRQEFLRYKRVSINGAQALMAERRCGITQGKWLSERQDENWRADIVEVISRLSTLRNCIARLAAPILPAVSKFAVIAKSAARSFGFGVTVQSKRRPVHIVAVGRSEERKPVYNLTVADAHLFYAGGFLSSNTEGEDHAADDVRYAVLSRPYLPRVAVETKKPDQVEFQVKDGRLVSNMTVREIVEAKMKRKDKD